MTFESAQLENVFWIGGSPCSGKSSISQILAKRYNLDLFSVDSAFNFQISRLNPIDHPYLTRWQQMSWEERWMRPLDVLLEEVIDCYREHFSLIKEDVLQKNPARILLVEGSAVLPDPTAELISDHRQAIWVVPTPDFQTLHYSQRNWAWQVLSSCSDPETAFANWMERDIQFAAWISKRVQELGLKHLVVDGSRTIEENMSCIAEYFHLSGG